MYKSTLSSSSSSSWHWLVSHHPFFCPQVFVLFLKLKPKHSHFFFDSKCSCNTTYFFLEQLTRPGFKVFLGFLEVTLSCAESCERASMQGEKIIRLLVENISVKLVGGQSARWISSGPARNIATPSTWHLDSLQKRWPSESSGNGESAPLFTPLIWTLRTHICFCSVILSLSVMSQLIGYSEKPVNLQMFIGTADDRYLRPHAFYQVHRITGKTVATASQEIMVSSTKVLEIPLLPENNMSAR